MKQSDLIASLKKNITLRAKEPLPPVADLRHIVRTFAERRDEFLALKDKTPCYVLDVKELRAALESYSSAFSSFVPRHKAYYALKVNHHQELVSRIVQAGFGIDASSAREMEIALAAGATDILLTGPGKSEKELSKALQHTDKVRINIDSFGELTRLGSLAQKHGVVVRAGVRVTGRSTERWNKFGIPLSELRAFWESARKYQGSLKTSGIILEGIQFHSSWNLDASPYAEMIAEVGEYLKASFRPEELSWIKFIDCGGGFRPYKSEGTYAWKLPQGAAHKALDPDFELPGPFADRVFETAASTPEEYARGIGTAVTRELSFLGDVSIYTEPGRVLCNNAMHILLTVVDKKAADVVILDGGINLIGWERFEHDYFPVINLSRPATEDEVPCRLYGPLCMPQDQWGFGYYGTGIEEGDLLLVPYQGALTFSLAQEFIREIAPVVVLA
jgi:diaminopimelate decarboxylase